MTSKDLLIEFAVWSVFREHGLNTGVTLRITAQLYKTPATVPDLCKLCGIQSTESAKVAMSNLNSAFGARAYKYAGTGGGARKAQPRELHAHLRSLIDTKIEQLRKELSDA